jgi:hypothetical protein
MRTNTVRQPTVFTHEGAPAVVLGAEKALQRATMACMLWEDTFYESGVDIGQRIGELVHRVSLRVGHGAWETVEGFSEAVFDYILALEKD